MSDVNSWLDERRRVHAAATVGPWQFTNFGVDGPGPPNPDDRFDVMPVLIARTEESHEDTKAIVDAHNHFPAALTAIEAVLAVHWPVEVEPSDTICGECSNRLPNGLFMPVVEYPCETVRALEAVICGDQ